MDRRKRKSGLGEIETDPTPMKNEHQKPDSEIELVLAEGAERRLNQIEDGEVETIPGEQVMKEL